MESLMSKCCVLRGGREIPNETMGQEKRFQLVMRKRTVYEFGCSNLP